ncbi:MAG: cupredoxin domain-containing protein [Candidatus Micrarchaeota archaeon]
MKLFSVLAILLFSGILLFGCTSAQPSATPTQSAQTATPIQTLQASAPATSTPQGTPSMQEFRLEAKNWEWAPSTIAVKKGIPVKLTITSTKGNHGFGLPEFGVSKSVNLGETVVVQFIPDKAGEFVFSCSVYCGSGHQAMKGKLIVTE